MNIHYLENWKTGEDNHYEAVAKFDFQGETPKELSFRSGQKVILAPKGRIETLSSLNYHQV